MFKKCLKYDLKSFRTVFLIASAVILVLSVFCGLLFGNSITAEAEKSYIVDNNITPSTFENLFLNIRIVLSTLAYIIVYPAITLYLGLIGILRLVRYYMHCFTDQGYLTFTLPVKRKTLFLSKVASHGIYVLASFGVLLLGLVIILFEIALLCLLSPYTRDRIPSMLSSVIHKPHLGYLLVLGFLIGVLFLALIFVAMMFDYLIITLAATLFRRLKIVSVLVGYYAITNIILAPIYYIATYYLMFAAMFGAFGFMHLFAIPPVGFAGIYLIIIIAILAAITFGIFLMNFTVWRLERKINLA